MRRLGRWSKEPLLHFVLLGAVVCGLHRWVAPPAPSKRIVLSESAINGLRRDHSRRSGALPTAEEEQSLIEQFIDNEVLYREALAMGLDRGDVIVRRRLVQKMEFVTEGFDPAPDANDTELQAYLDAHRDRYALPERLTLTHVFVSSDRHSADADRVAAALRAQLAAAADAAALGDPFLRGAEFRQRSERELAAVFGAQFAAQAMALPAGAWSEPLRSSYGVHLVRVTERSAARVPALAEVRAAVLRDWQTQRRTEASREALRRLRAQYDIRIERPAAVLARR